LLILALGRALYTRKHCLDKAVNVGSIPTSPTIHGLNICMHVDIVFRFPDETKIITVDLFDNPGVRAWAAHCATLPAQRQIIYQHIPGDIDTTVPVELWPEYQRIEHELQSTMYALPLIAESVETVTQHHLNVWHRWFTVHTKDMDLRNQSLTNNEQQIYNLLHDLNQLVHKWENRLLGWPKKYLGKYGQGIEINLTPEKDAHGSAPFIALTEEQRQYHSFDVADLVLDQSVHGKTTLQSFIDNDDPNHWDTTGHWITHGGCKLVLSHWKQHVYNSDEFATWLNNNNTGKSQLKGEFPLGMIRNRDQVLLDQLEKQFDNLHETMTEFVVHLY